jgi:predicted nucleic acid-binding protein
MTAATRYTIDASVFLNGLNPAEVGYVDSNKLLVQVRAKAVPIIVPSLLFPEVAATISRVQGDANMARSFAHALRNWPNMIVIPLDDALSGEAVDAAARYHLRGSDAVYVAVAIRFDTILVTLDREQRSRASAVIVTISPADAISPNG